MSVLLKQRTAFYRWLFLLTLLSGVMCFAIRQISPLYQSSVTPESLYSHSFTTSKAIDSINALLGELDNHLSKNISGLIEWRQVDLSLPRDIQTKHQEVFDNFKRLTASYIGKQQDIDLALGSFNALTVTHQEILFNLQQGFAEKAQLLYDNNAKQINKDLSNRLSAIEINAEQKTELFLLEQDNQMQNSQYYLGSIILTFIILITLITAGFSYRLVTINRSLIKSKTWLQQVLQATPDALFILNPEEEIIDVNDSVISLLGYQASELKNKAFSVIFAEQEKQQQQAFVDSFFNTSTTECSSLNHLSVATKSGQLLDVELNLNEANIAGKRYCIASIRDVTEAKSEQEKIYYQANYDFLTDLPNRGFSLERLEQLKAENLRAGRELAVIFLDLDDFKIVNDTLGHEAGDALLQQIAERLKAHLRSGDLVGRLGGDEFIILSGGLNSATDAHKVIENIQHAFERSFVIEGREIQATTSIGIAMFPSDSCDSKELLRKADSAMFHAKASNTLKYAFFIDNMNYKVSRQFIVEEAMQKAVGSQEFYVVYQPQVDLTTGKVHGAEAFLRWNSASLGEVPTQEFISVAQCNGLIEPIGEMLVRESIYMAKRWQNIIHDFEVSINISARQLHQPNFVSLLTELCRDHGVAFNYITLEVTEAVFFDDSSIVSHKLKQLSSLGFNLSMDDFGTGYSSLNYLREYDFKQLKLDKSFISSVNDDENVRILLTAAIAMANALNIDIVAEGVENLAQKMKLQSMGCEFGQGYYYSNVLSVDEMTEYLQTHKQSYFLSTHLG